ncbi:hypothetical protein A0H81_04717 [Grifola frondosa]|uniref:Uncharacterized protein n=1 Tax=Grifola frondosa TaxID=5627 RepID=A0A1C7MFB5_GRIFR|nr:hypothetical protein A0H81_04717 [Grifola frondosa]
MIRKKIIVGQDHFSTASEEVLLVPDVLRVKGSIVPRIVGPVLTVTIWATLAAYAWSRGSRWPHSRVQECTSYDRYYEGRKDFGTMMSHIRNVSRLIWLNVGVPPSDDITKGKSPGANLTAAQLRRRKVDALKLCVCFAFAVKIIYAERMGLTGMTTRVYFPSTARSRATVTVLAKHPHSCYILPLLDMRSNSNSRIVTPEEYENEDNRPASVDATKRIRVKRSKDKLKQPSTRIAKTQKTPAKLIASNNRL